MSAPTLLRPSSSFSMCSTMRGSRALVMVPACGASGGVIDATLDGAHQRAPGWPEETAPRGLPEPQQAGQGDRLNCRYYRAGTGRWVSVQACDQYSAFF